MRGFPETVEDPAPSISRQVVSGLTKVDEARVLREQEGDVDAEGIRTDSGGSHRTKP
jgi:hypothetical protein